MSLDTKKETNRAEVPVSLKKQSAPSRPRRSALSKLTFWSFLVGTILCASITVVVTLTAGFPNNVVISATTALMLICTILTGTSARWVPAVSTVLGALILYLIFTEPFVIESLANPKLDPQGGFGHYIGVILITASVLIAFSASCATAVVTYLQTGPKAPRWLPSTVSLIAGMAIGALIIGAMGPSVAAGGTSYTNGVPTVHMSAASFLQTSVTIQKGSKLLLVDDVNAHHVLSNGSWENGQPAPATEPGAPQVSSLSVQGNSVEIGPFNTAGTYHIYCEIHRNMNLTIIVQ